MINWCKKNTCSCQRLNFILVANTMAPPRISWVNIDAAVLNNKFSFYSKRGNITPWYQGLSLWTPCHQMSTVYKSMSLCNCSISVTKTYNEACKSDIPKVLVIPVVPRLPRKLNHQRMVANWICNTSTILTRMLDLSDWLLAAAALLLLRLGLVKAFCASMSESIIDFWVTAIKLSSESEWWSSMSSISM